MHGCIISAYIRHLRSLKIRLVHPPKIISLCRHCHLIVSFVVISLCHLTVPSHCAISQCVIVISLCHLTVPSHCVVIVISLCQFTVPSHCVVIVISLCRHCHLTLSFHCAISLCHFTVPSHCAISLCHFTVPSHCVVIVISMCRQCLLTVSSLSSQYVVIVVNMLDQIPQQTSRKSPPCCLGLRLRAWHQTSHT